MAEIDEDRQTLIDLMSEWHLEERVKQATTWLAEKASRAKFTGLTSESTSWAPSMALEALTLGVEEKATLWRALIAVAEWYRALGSVDLDGTAGARGGRARGAGRREGCGGPRCGLRGE